MATTDLKPLKIIIGESTHPIVENIEGKDSSLFAELYDKTFSCIENYLEAVAYGEKKNDDFKTSAKTDYPNNIIAFIGERGSGKTSCMLSVTEMLQNKKESNAFQNYPVLNTTQFVSVNVIEPSFINDKANVLELVVATLFRNFKETVEKDVEHIDLNKKHSLLEVFQKVQENLKYIKNGTAELETIDSLLQLSSSVDLKENMRALVSSYLEFMNGTQQSILLLPIDDIDLNTKYAYDMVEQIRKYLVLPNVLILVSLKLDQLEQVLRNDFTKQFSDSLNKAQDKNSLLGDIQQMAERYIQKLLPLAHRIFMPDMEVAMDKPIEIICDDNHIHEDPEYDTATVKVRDFVVFLIKKKTKYRFYNKPGETNPLVPQNLRELVHFISFLWEMGNATQENKQTLNQSLFRNYFYSIWAKNHLGVQAYDMFNEIFSVCDAKVINATVIKVLRRIIIEEKLQEKEIEEIISEKNYSYNISIADVVEVLHFIEQKSCSKEYKILCAAIKVHYDFKLFEFAEELIERGGLYTIGKQMTSDEKYLFNDSILNDFSNYALLIGGKYFHCDNSMLPSQGNNRVFNPLDSRALRIVDGKIIRAKAEEIVNGKCKDVKVIRVIEFFALHSTVINFTTKQSYRTMRDIWYRAEMPKRQVNILFDATVSIYNKLDVQNAYDRICPGLFNAINTFDNEKTCLDEKSLFANIQSENANQSFNNFTEIEGLIRYLFACKPKSEGTDIDILCTFYDNLCQFRREGGVNLSYAQKFKLIFDSSTGKPNLFLTIYHGGLLKPNWEKKKKTHSGKDIIEAYKTSNESLWEAFGPQIEGMISKEKSYQSKDLSKLHKAIVNSIFS